MVLLFHRRTRLILLGVASSLILTACLPSPDRDNPLDPESAAHIPATPTFSPPPGTYTNAQSVAIFCASPKATIHYTTDGAMPTAESPVYSNAITMVQSNTVRAIAVNRWGAKNSFVNSGVYKIPQAAAPPSVEVPIFAPPAGPCVWGQPVAISSSTLGATIYYTTDGSTPTPSSLVYTAPLTLASTKTLKAIAVKTGWSNSPASAALYTIQFLVVAHGNSPYITVYDLADWSKIPNPSTLPSGGGLGVAFSPNGGTLAVANSGSPALTLYSTSDWLKLANPASLPTSTGQGAAYSLDGLTLAVAHNSSPFITIYNTSDWSKVPNPSVLPVGPNGTGSAFSPDGSKLAVAHEGSPYVTVYNTSDWSKLPDPAVLPTGKGWNAAFSPDGSKLAVAHYNSPYVTIYNTSDWSKIPDPAILPSFHGFGVAFSPNGNNLAVSHGNPPYVTIYSIPSWTKIPNPSTLPNSTGNGIAYSPDGTKLAVATYSSPYVTIYHTSDWSKIPDPAILPTGGGNGAIGIAFSP